MLNVRIHFIKTNYRFYAFLLQLNIYLVLLVDIVQHLLLYWSEELKHLFKAWSFVLVIDKHFLCYYSPILVQLLWILNSPFAILKGVELADQFCLGCNIAKKLSSHKHLIKNNPRTPYITFLIIIFKFKNLRCCIQRSTCPFGHVTIYLSGQPKICNFEVQMLIQ